MDNCTTFQRAMPAEFQRAMPAEKGTWETDINQLDKENCRLGNLIDELGAKIMPILAADNGMMGKQREDEVEPQSPIRGALFHLRHRLIDNADRLQELIKRIDI